MFKRFKNINIVKIISSFILVLYALVVWIMIWAKHTNAILIFCVIPLCLLASLINRNKLFILIGEGITIAADTFLILRDQIDVGMGIFIFAQISYAIYFFLEDYDQKERIIVVVARIILMVLLLAAAKLVMKEKFNLVVIFAMLYLGNLVVNIACGFMLKQYYLVIAFILFLLCDTCIGLGFLLPSDNPFLDFINKMNFTHIFYIPSQVMIALYPIYCDICKELILNKPNALNI